MAVRQFKSKIQITLFGDSHACDLHFLPQALRQKLKSSHYFDAEPAFDAIPGRKLDDEFVRQVKQSMNLKTGQGSPQVYVLMIGSSNIRRRHQNIGKFFDKLLADVCDLPKIHVLLLSMLPCPATDEQSKSRFMEVNAHLKSLSKRYPLKSSYLPIHKIFTFGGAPKYELFELDLIHLNKDGAQVLADSIFRHLSIIKKSQLDKL